MNPTGVSSSQAGRPSAPHRRATIRSSRHRRQPHRHASQLNALYRPAGAATLRTVSCHTASRDPATRRRLRAATPDCAPHGIAPQATPRSAGLPFAALLDAPLAPRRTASQVAPSLHTAGSAWPRPSTHRTAPPLAAGYARRRDAGVRRARRRITSLATLRMAASRAASHRTSTPLAAPQASHRIPAPGYAPHRSAPSRNAGTSSLRFTLHVPARHRLTPQACRGVAWRLILSHGSAPWRTAGASTPRPATHHYATSRCSPRRNYPVRPRKATAGL